MKTFIQLKDNVGWAFVNTTESIPGGIEVEFGTGEFFLKKKYENNSWVNADLIKYAEVNEDGVIVEVMRTYYVSEVSGPIMTPEIKLDFKWVDGSWLESIPLWQQSLNS
jgi:hypothetical protein